jgi:glycine cleavage system H protein
LGEALVEIGGFDFPEELYYDEHQQYARVENDEITIGLTAYAQAAAKEIVYVELPRPGRKVEQGKPLGSIESGKWVGRIYAMVGGQVTAANDKLADDAGWINRDPYGEGWIAKLKASDVSQLQSLKRCTDPGFADWFLAQVDKNKKK